jgi:DNA-binding transcriptional ArsR family regulator
MARDNQDDGKSLLELGSAGRDPVDKLDEHNSDESFTAEHKKAIALDQVRRAVRRYGEDGIAVSDLEEVTDLSRKTVQRHLDTLCNLREVYRQKKGKQMYLYYPNGKPLHGVGTERIECDDGDTILEVQLAQGKNDDLFFHVTEKRFSLLEGETTEGAIVFPLDSVDELFESLNELSEKITDSDDHQ